jgi:hypothetical protein
MTALSELYKTDFHAWTIDRILDFDFYPNEP